MGRGEEQAAALALVPATVPVQHRGWSHSWYLPPHCLSPPPVCTFGLLPSCLPPPASAPCLLVPTLPLTLTPALEGSIPAQPSAQSATPAQPSCSGGSSSSSSSFGQALGPELPHCHCFYWARLGPCFMTQAGVGTEPAGAKKGQVGGRDGGGRSQAGGQRLKALGDRNRGQKQWDGRHKQARQQRGKFGGTACRGKLLDPPPLLPPLLPHCCLPPSCFSCRVPPATVFPTAAVGGRGQI